TPRRKERPCLLGDVRLQRGELRIAEAFEDRRLFRVVPGGKEGLHSLAGLGAALGRESEAHSATGDEAHEREEAGHDDRVSAPHERHFPRIFEAATCIEATSFASRSLSAGAAGARGPALTCRSSSGSASPAAGPIRARP